MAADRDKVLGKYWPPAERRQRRTIVQIVADWETSWERETTGFGGNRRRHRRHAIAIGDNCLPISKLQCLPLATTFSSSLPNYSLSTRMPGTSYSHLFYTNTHDTDRYTSEDTHTHTLNIVAHLCGSNLDQCCKTLHFPCISIHIHTYVRIHSGRH